MNYHLRLEPTFSHKDRSGCEGEAQLRSAEVAGGPVAEVALAGAGPGLAITVGLQRRHAAGPHGGEVAKCFEAGVVEDVWRALSLNLALLSRLGVGALVASEPGNLTMCQAKGE